MSRYPFRYQCSPLGWALLSATAVCLVLSIGGMVVFTTRMQQPLAHALYGVFVCGSVVLLGGGGVWLSGREAAAVRRLGLALGALLAGVWIAETFVAHLLVPDDAKPTLGPILGTLTLGVSGALTLVVTGRSVYRSNDYRRGFQTGLWSGLLSGLLTFGAVLLMVYAFMPRLLLYGKDLQDFRDSGELDLASWFFWEELSGSLGFLVLLMLIGGFGGALGGGAGWLLARARPPAAHSTIHHNVDGRGLHAQLS